MSNISSLYRWRKAQGVIGIGKGLIFLLIILQINPIHFTAAAEPTPSIVNAAVIDEAKTRLDLTIAIDNSGSMYQDISSGTVANIDRGSTLLADITSGLPATDPDGLRFDSVRMLLEWLTQFKASDKGRNLEINVSIVAFDQAPNVLLDWQSINSQSSVSFENPSDPDGPNHSDFIALYDEVRNLQASRPEVDPDTPTHQALMVITDSLPCNPDPSAKIVDYVNGELVTIRDGCRTPRNMLYHLQLINPNNSLQGIDQYYYVLGDQGLFDSIAFDDSTIKEAYEGIADVEHFLRTVDGLPGEMFQDVLSKTARSLNISATAQEDRWATLGVYQAQSDGFVVPPYKRTMDVWSMVTVPTSDNPDEATPVTPPNNGDPSVVTFTPANGNASQPEILFNAGEGRLTAQRFSQPPPGEWNISGGSGVSVWLSFTDASTALSVEPTIAQYQPFEIIYAIDGADAAGDYKPHVSIKISDARDTYFLDEADFVFDRSKNGFVATFLPIRAGNYQVELVEAGPPSGGDATWQSLQVPIPYDFLRPSVPIASIDVRPVQLQVTFGTADQQTKIINDTQMVIPRQQAVPVTVTAMITDDQSATNLNAVLDVQAEVIVNAVSNRDEVCAPRDGQSSAAPALPLAIALAPTAAPNGDWSSATGEVILAAEGMCEVQVAVSFASLPAVLGLTSFDVPNVQVNVMTLEATASQILTVALVDAEGSAVAASAAPSTKFELQDLKAIPSRLPSELSWPPDIWEGNTLQFELVYLNEANEPIDPRFTPDCQLLEPNVAPTADLGSGSSAASNPTLPLCPIPFDLRITDENNHDVVAEHDIVITKSPKTGYYVATVRGLEAGQYKVEIDLRVEDPSLNENPALGEDGFSYSPVLLQAENDNLVPFRATLDVSRNPLVNGQIYGFLGFVGVFASVVIFRSGRYYLTHVNPLSGGVVIWKQYRGSAYPNNSCEPVWATELPRRLNRHRLELDRLPPIDPPITKLVFSTERSARLSKAGEATVKLQVNGEPTPIESLISTPLTGGPWMPAAGLLPFYTDNEGSLFYLVKCPDIPESIKLHLAQVDTIN